MSLNMGIIVGRAGQDAEEKTTSKGKNLAEVSIATDDWKGKDNKITEWHNVVAWGWAIETLAKVRKGDLVMVIGRRSIDEYTGRDGQAKTSTKLTADKVLILVERASERASTEQDEEDYPDDGQPEATSPKREEPDLPF